MEHTFEVDGCQMTVHSATVGSRIIRDVLIGSLAGQLSGRVYPVIMFADMVSQTSIDGGDLNGWTPPTMNDPAETVVESFQAWLELPGSVYDAWQSAMRAVDAPRPEALDDEKKATSSAG